MGGHRVKVVTNAGDKLVAIAALAEEYSIRYGYELGSYLAGHWYNELTRSSSSLMWAVKPSSRQPEPGKWRAPSWSWASVEGSGSTHLRIEIFESHCRVISGHTTLLHLNQPFGAVTGGAIQVDCSIAKALWDSHLSREDYYFDSNLELVKHGQMYKTWDATADTLEFQPQSPIKVEIVLLGFDSELRGYTSEWGLILKQQPGGTYVRIGAFRSWGEFTSVFLSIAESKTIIIE